MRTAGASAAVAVLALDISKGYAVVWLARSLGAGPIVQGSVAAAVVAGHIFPLWLRFRGGKGVATACGAFAVLAPSATVIAVIVFAMVVSVSRYVSLGSITSAVLLPPLTYVMAAPMPTVVSALGVALLVLFRHRVNAARLYAGIERRIGQRISG